MLSLIVNISLFDNEGGDIIKVNIKQLFQLLAILGFILAFFEIGIGWFIGFFFSGLFFIIMVNKNGERSKINIILGLFILAYSFYTLYTQSNLFHT